VSGRSAAIRVRPVQCPAELPGVRSVGSVAPDVVVDELQDHQVRRHLGIAHQRLVLVVAVVAPFTA
jgi:hypothetical protein